jgi:hypothetical protein
MLGNPTHSVVDLDSDDIDMALLDETDSGTITNSFVDFDEIDTNVVHTTDISGFASITNGVVTLTAPSTFSAVTGDAADFLTVYKNSGSPATSPLILTWDSATGGIPVTPNTGDIIATWGSNILVTLT